MAESTKHTNPNNSTSRELFSNVKVTKTSAVLRAEQELTFHIWTTSNTCYHTHDNYLEIFIVTSGKLLHNFCGESSVMKAGDAFIIFPGQYHSQSQYKNYTSQHINLTCSLPFAAALSQAYFGTESPTFPSQLIHFTDAEFAVIMEMQDLILRSQSDAYLKATLRTLLCFALGYFQMPDREVERADEMPKWLVKFIQALKNIDFTDPVRLSELYAMSGYSQSTLSMQFKKHMGQTLVSYINDLKLNHACNQLKNTTFTLAEIAKFSGFESYPHFSRLFKSKYGLTPQQYRNTQLRTPSKL